jgi:hypothetical protein
MREEDPHLMDKFLSEHLTTAELGDLNACRMYLQVTTLAE